MGGCRMGKDPSTSLLNKWNQFHNCKNAFVTDGACMTSTGNQTPSILYMALTARAAGHAVEELAKQNLRRASRNATDEPAGSREDRHTAGCPRKGDDQRLSGRVRPGFARNRVESAHPRRRSTDRRNRGYAAADYSVVARCESSGRGGRDQSCPHRLL